MSKSRNNSQTMEQLSKKSKRWSKQSKKVCQKVEKWSTNQNFNLKLEKSF